jgi:hypothetical protein
MAEGASEGGAPGAARPSVKPDPPADNSNGYKEEGDDKSRLERRSRYDDTAISFLFIFIDFKANLFVSIGLPP